MDKLLESMFARKLGFLKRVLSTFWRMVGKTVPAIESLWVQTAADVMISFLQAAFVGSRTLIRVLQHLVPVQNWGEELWKKPV